jgi:antirestriction protein ArdC
MSQKVYQIVTDRILKLLEQGEIPWRKQWTSHGMPQNLVSKKEYRGINALLLASTKYSNPYWLTYRQAQKLGGQVNRGEKGTFVIFWKIFNTVKVEDPVSGEKIEIPSNKTVPFLRYYTVFNADQCDLPAGVVPELELNDNDPIEECEKILDGYKDMPPITTGHHKACYRPGSDQIELPDISQFVNSEAYHAVKFHEVVHSTGHKSRLNRPGIADISPFGSPGYGKEELVAEFGASFLCGLTGIENVTVENSASYIAGWSKTIKKDPKLIIFAATQAQKAVDYILGR